MKFARENNFTYFPSDEYSLFHLPDVATATLLADICKICENFVPHSLPPPSPLPCSCIVARSKRSSRLLTFSTTTTSEFSQTFHFTSSFSRILSIRRLDVGGGRRKFTIIRFFPKPYLHFLQFLSIASQRAYGKDNLAPARPVRADRGRPRRADGQQTQPKVLDSSGSSIQPI